MTTALTQEVYDAVHAHAYANYSKGWDFVVECYGFDDVAFLLEASPAALTDAKKAIAWFAKMVKVQKEAASNARFGDEF